MFIYDISDTRIILVELTTSSEPIGSFMIESRPESWPSGDVFEVDISRENLR